MKLLEKLQQLSACSEAIEWVKENNHETLEKAWDACHRGDWMLWLAYHMKVDKRKLTLAKGRCAETVIHLMEDQRGIDAVKAAIAYGNGEINDEQLRDAAHAAYAAAAAAYGAAYGAAADAAAAAYGAAADGAAADAAAYGAAAYGAAYGAKKENQQKTADICREILTDDVLTASGH